MSGIFGLVGGAAEGAAAGAAADAATSAAADSAASAAADSAASTAVGDAAASGALQSATTAAASEIPNTSITKSAIEGLANSQISPSTSRVSPAITPNSQTSGALLNSREFSDLRGSDVFKQMASNQSNSQPRQANFSDTYRNFKTMSPGRGGGYSQSFQSNDKPFLSDTSVGVPTQSPQFSALWDYLKGGNNS